MRSFPPGSATAAMSEPSPWPRFEATTQLQSSDASPVAPSAILAQITADLAVGSDLSELLQRFLDPIVSVANAQAGAVRVLSLQGDRLELVGSTGLPDRRARGRAAGGQPLRLLRPGRRGAARDLGLRPEPLRLAQLRRIFR